MKKYVLAICVVGQFALLVDAPMAAEKQPSNNSQVWPVDLTHFLNSVINNHPDTKVALAAVARARRQAGVMDQPVANPELEIEGTNRDTDIQPDGSKPDASRTRAIGVSLTTDFGIKQKIKRSLGSYEVTIASAKRAELENDLGGQAVLALATYYSEKEVAQLAEQQEQTMIRFIEQAEKLRNAGETSATDLSLAKLTWAETLRANLEAKGRLEQAVVDLQALCLCDATTPPVLPIDFPNFDQPDFDRLIQTHPALRSTKAAVNKARTHVRLAKAEQVTDPTFRLSGGTEGKARFLTVGVSIPIPVLRTGAPEIREAENALVEAENMDYAEFMMRKRQAVSSFRNYDVAKRTHALWQTQNIASIEEQSKLLGRLWKAGEMSTTEYLIKIKETIEASKTGALLRGQAWSALSRWLVDSNKLRQFIGE